MITSFIFGITAILAVVLIWSFKCLTTDKYQMLACIPKSKLGDDYDGVNFTYYGFILASASVFSALIYLILMGFAAIPLGITLVNLALILLITIPSAGWMARIIEHKRHSFTVGGAGFVAYIVAPIIISLTSLAYSISALKIIIPTLAAMQIAFILGEGLGRLGCISFGCCYGQPIDSLAPFWKRLFSKWHFVYSSPTRKACYASGLQDQKLVPIQGITSIIYCLAGLLGIVLFLSGHYGLALCIAALIHQLWRILSEFFRADYRGKFLNISKYQLMAFASVGYAILLSFIFPIPDIVTVPLATVFKSLWTPTTILFIQFQWLSIFYFTGRSRVTGSKLRFHIHEDKI